MSQASLLDTARRYLLAGVIVALTHMALARLGFGAGWVLTGAFVLAAWWIQPIPGLVLLTLLAESTATTFGGTFVVAIGLVVILARLVPVGTVRGHIGIVMLSAAVGIAATVAGSVVPMAHSSHTIADIVVTPAIGWLALGWAILALSFGGIRWLSHFVRPAHSRVTPIAYLRRI